MPLNIERHMNDVIAPGGMVKFDKTVYNHYDASYGGGVGYTIMDNCIIHIHKPGDYGIKWSSSQMTGFSVDSEYFCMKQRVEKDDKTDYEWIDFTNNEHKTHAMLHSVTLVETPDMYEQWNNVPPAYSYDSRGFALDSLGKRIAEPYIDDLGATKYYALDSTEHRITVNVPMKDLEGNIVLDPSGNPIPKALLTIALFNITDKNVKLSPHNNVKASIMVFNVPPLYREGTVMAKRVVEICEQMDDYEVDITVNDIESRHEQLLGMKTWQDEELLSLNQKVIELEQDFEDYFKNSQYVKAKSLLFDGIWVCYTQSGSTYSFWASGTVNKVPVTKVGQKLMLIDVNACEVLKKYLGDAAVTPCYCITHSGEKYWKPLYFDSTGSYFVSDSLDFLNDLKTIKFTRILILR